MLIKILMIIFILLLICLGIFLLRHIEKPFFITKKANLKPLQKLMKITAILLFIVSIIGIILLFFLPAKANLTTLILGSVVVAVFAVMVSRLV